MTLVTLMPELNPLCPKLRNNKNFIKFKIHFLNFGKFIRRFTQLVSDFQNFCLQDLSKIPHSLMYL